MNWLAKKERQICLFNNMINLSWSLHMMCVCIVRTKYYRPWEWGHFVWSSLLYRTVWGTRLSFRAETSIRSGLGAKEIIVSMSVLMSIEVQMCVCCWPHRKLDGSHYSVSKQRQSLYWERDRETDRERERDVLALTHVSFLCVNNYQWF